MKLNGRGLGFPVCLLAVVLVAGCGHNKTETAPVANADYSETSSGVACEGNVLENDTAGFGKSLHVSDYEATSAYGGTITMERGGNFTYMPPPAHAGGDQFAYTASDGSLTDATTVFIHTKKFEMIRITASDGEERDGFGQAVAIHGEIALVGALGANSVYVYLKDSVTGVWNEETTLGGA